MNSLTAMTQLLIGGYNNAGSFSATANFKGLLSQCRISLEARYTPGQTFKPKPDLTPAEGDNVLFFLGSKQLDTTNGQRMPVSGSGIFELSRPAA